MAAWDDSRNYHMQYTIANIISCGVRSIGTGLLLEEKAKFMENGVRMLCEWKGLEVEGLNVRKDHVYVILGIPPKNSVSEVMGMLKGKTAIKMFQRYPEMKKKPYWGNHFWARGYCVSTIGLDEEKIKKYVQYQEEQERQEEAHQIEFGF